MYLDTNISLAYVARHIGDEKLKRRIVYWQINKGREFYSTLDDWLDLAKDMNIIFSISPTILGETVIKIFKIMKERKEWADLIDRAATTVQKLVEESTDIKIVQFGGLNDDENKRIRFEMFIDFLDKIKDNEARSNYADRVILAFSASDPNSFGLLTNDEDLLGDINKSISNTFLEDSKNNSNRFIDYVQLKRSSTKPNLKFHVTDNLHELLEFIHKEESRGRY